MTQKQLALLFDYCKYFRLAAEKLTREARNSHAMDEKLRSAIVKEQTRRAKELKLLEKALGDELGKGSEKEEWPEHAENRSYSDTAPGTKRKNRSTGKKSKRRAVGSAGRESSGKNANSTRRNRKRKDPGTNESQFIPGGNT